MAKCDSLIAHPHRYVTGEGASKTSISEHRPSEHRNRTEIATRHGGTCHRYGNRCIARHHRSLRRPSGGGEQARRGDRGGAPAGKATLNRQHHYAGSRWQACLLRSCSDIGRAATPGRWPSHGVGQNQIGLSIGLICRIRRQVCQGDQDFPRIDWLFRLAWLFRCCRLTLLCLPLRLA